MYHNPSDAWDTKEKKMDASDIKAGEDDGKEEVKVVTEEHADIPFSGMFCVICRDHATFIYEGDSLCWKHYDDKLADILKEHKEAKNK